MSIDKLDLELLNNEYKNKSPFEIITYVYDKIGASRVALASSLSIEDQLLTDIILKIDNKARIFFIDTQRHNRRKCRVELTQYAD
ncbi:MAG: hypothetical protein QJR05_11610, partial [Thermoanaerobacterium sp.]|nr:hypothetical protein [Thermoanaerobacterium sp.]